MQDYQGKAFATGIAEGFTADGSFVPTATAYGAGDIMDVTQEMLLTDRRGLLVPEKSLIQVIAAIVKINVASIPSGQTSYTLQLYSAAPPSAQNDNDAWTLALTDLDSYHGSIALGAPVDVGGALYIRTDGLNMNLRLITPSIFARLVTDGGHTPAAVARAVRLHAVVV